LTSRLVLAAVLACGVARAAEPTPDPDARLAPIRVDPAQLDRAARSASWRRNVGIGLAAPGVAMLILGSVLITNGTSDPNLAGGGAQIASGIVVAAVGLPLAIAGIVLWILGQDDLDVVSWRRKQQEKNRLSQVSRIRQVGLTPGGLGFSF